MHLNCNCSVVIIVNNYMTITLQLYLNIWHLYILTDFYTTTLTISTSLVLYLYMDIRKIKCMNEWIWYDMVWYDWYYWYDWYDIWYDMIQYDMIYDICDVMCCYAMWYIILYYIILYYTANIFSANEEFLHVLWNQKAYYCVHECLPIVHILSLMNQLHTLPSCFRMNFNTARCVSKK